MATTEFWAATVGVGATAALGATFLCNALPVLFETDSAVDLTSTKDRTNARMFSAAFALIAWAVAGLVTICSLAHLGEMGIGNILSPAGAVILLAFDFLFLALVTLIASAGGSDKVFAQANQVSTTSNPDSASGS